MKIRDAKYIVSPVYDWLFFIGSPLIACALGTALVRFIAAGYPETVHWWGNEASLSGLLALTQAHLVAVFFRSHGNPQIFKQFPWRFTLVPVLLLASIFYSSWLMALAGFIVVWWDVYHTSQQNFGLARIYDARSGNGIPEGRCMEKMYHLIFYLCPILAGSYLMAHVNGFMAFRAMKLDFLGVTLPEWVQKHAESIRYVAIGLGTLALISFLVFECRRHRGGYRYPFPKVMIIFSTVLCSILAWGFNKFGDAYFIVNLYHAVQYFAIVWATEQKQDGSVLFRVQRSHGKAIAFLFFFIPPIIVGTWFEFGSWQKLTLALLLTCALLHFWYDGFIWSVRKKSV